MAHKSKKKHLKHLHARQRAEAADHAETSHDHRGIISSLAHAASEKAHAATEKIVEKERNIVKRVKSLLG
jgi:hypothetical protein